MILKKQALSGKTLNLLMFLLFKGLLIIMVMLSPLIAYVLLPKNLYSNELKDPLEFSTKEHSLNERSTYPYVDGMHHLEVFKGSIKNNEYLGNPSNTLDYIDNQMPYTINNLNLLYSKSGSWPCILEGASPRDMVGIIEGYSQGYTSSEIKPVLAIADINNGSLMTPRDQVTVVGKLTPEVHSNQAVAKLPGKSVDSLSKDQVAKKLAEIPTIPASPILPDSNMKKVPLMPIPANADNGTKDISDSDKNQAVAKLPSESIVQNFSPERAENVLLPSKSLVMESKEKSPAIEKSLDVTNSPDLNASEPGESIMDLYSTQSINSLYAPFPESMLVSHNSDNDYLKDLMQRKDYIELVFHNIKNENIVVLSALIDILQDTEVTNVNNETPLIYAVKLGKIDSLKVLLAKGANVNAKSGRELLSPLEIAKKNGSKTIQEVIEQNI